MKIPRTRPRKYRAGEYIEQNSDCFEVDMGGLELEEPTTINPRGVN